MGLIANFKFENDFVDSLGLHKITQSGGTPTYSNGRMGRALVGQNTRLLTSIEDNTGDLSFSVWYQNSTLNWNSWAIAGSRNGTNGWMVYRNSGDTLGYFRVYFHYINTAGSTIAYRAWPGFSNLNDTNWHNLILTKSAGGAMTLWQDKVKVYDQPAPTDFVRWTASPRFINILTDGDGNYNSNSGVIIDEFKFYDHVLSDNEIMDIHSEKIIHLKADGESLNDSSGNNLNFGANTAVQFSNNSKFGTHSFNFPVGIQNKFIDYGVDPHFQFGNNGPFSVSAWINMSVLSARDIIVIKSNNRAAPYTFLIGFTDNGKMSVYDNTAWISTPPLTQLTLNTWHHAVWSYNGTTLSMYFNNVLIGSYALNYTDVSSHKFMIGGHGTNNDFTGLLDDLIIYKTGINASTVKELYQSRLVSDNKGNVFVKSITETKQTKALIDWTIWQNGQTGSIGTFNQNGSTSENSRVMGLDPWGKNVVLWQATPDADNNADGGWNTNNFTIDRTKLYRFSVWIKRNAIGNGSSYLGALNGGGNLLRRDTLVEDNNPYFYYSSNLGVTNEWVLIVGHIWPVGSGAGAFHPDTGRYTIDDKIGGVLYDFVWNTGTTSAGHRSYLYYCTNTTVRQWWCYPRVDICDGTEPSIAELQAGLDSRSYDLYKTKGLTKTTSLELTDKTIYTPYLNEVGIIKDCIAWWKFDTNSNELIGGTTGTDTAVTYGSGNNNGGAKFLASNALINVGNDIRFKPSAITVSVWFRIETWEGLRQIMLVNWLGYSCEISTEKKPYFRVYTTSGIVDSPHGPTLNNDEWYLFTGTYEAGVGTSAYLNGVHFGTTVSSNNISYDGGNLVIGQYSNSLRFIGTLDNIKIFKSRLSAEYISRLYAEGRKSMFSVDKDTMYISGNLIENK
jgi:hypothetical protein